MANQAADPRQFADVLARCQIAFRFGICQSRKPPAQRALGSALRQACRLNGHEVHPSSGAGAHPPEVTAVDTVLHGKAVLTVGDGSLCNARRQIRLGASKGAVLLARPGLARKRCTGSQLCTAPRLRGVESLTQ